MKEIFKALKKYFGMLLIFLLLGSLLNIGSPAIKFEPCSKTVAFNSTFSNLFGISEEKAEKLLCVSPDQEIKGYKLKGQNLVIKFEINGIKVLNSKDIKWKLVKQELSKYVLEGEVSILLGKTLKHYVIQATVNTRKNGNLFDIQYEIRPEFGSENINFNALLILETEKPAKVFIGNAKKMNTFDYPSSKKVIGIDGKEFIFGSVLNNHFVALIPKGKAYSLSVDANDESATQIITKIEKFSGYQLVLGPTIYSVLNKYKNFGLEKISSYGFYSILITPLLRLTEILNKFIQNPIISLFILALFLVIIQFPITIKAVAIAKKILQIKMEVDSLDPNMSSKQKLEMQQNIYQLKGINSGWVIASKVVQLIFYSVLSGVSDNFYAAIGKNFLWISDISLLEKFSLLDLHGKLGFTSNLFRNMGIFSAISAFSLYILFQFDEDAEPNSKNILFFVTFGWWFLQTSRYKVITSLATSAYILFQIIAKTILL